MLDEALTTVLGPHADSPYANRLHLHFGDVTDFGSLCGLVNRILPVEIYNLAAQSHVQVSFELPSYTAEAAGQVRKRARTRVGSSTARPVKHSPLSRAIKILSIQQGVLNVLEAVRAAGLSTQCRVYQASTSELYGKVAEVPQTEVTPFYPRSPYAVSKLFGFWIVKNYRCCALAMLSRS